MKRIKTILRIAGQWLLFVVLFAWGFFSFFFLAGEDATGAMPIIAFIGIKIGALISLVACGFVAYICHACGWLPDFIDKLDKPKQ